MSDKAIVLRQSFEIRSAGGRFDSRRVPMPLADQVKDKARKYGLQATISQSGPIVFSARDLRLDTLIETETGSCTVAQALQQTAFAATGKVRCQTPFRDSESFAAFLGRGKDRRPFIHDLGTGITHWLSDAEWRLQSPIKADGRHLVADLGSKRDYMVTRFLHRDPPEMRWLLEDTLPLGVVGTVVAQGGTGKSMFLIQVAVSISSGFPLVGGTWTVAETGGVLVLAAEDSEAELHRRFRNLYDALPLHDLHTIGERLNANLYIASRVGANNLLTSTDGYSRDVLLTDFVTQVIALASDIQNLKLIIIDPVSRFRGGDENAAADATRFVEALELIAKETGATVLAAHHTNKGAQHASEPSQSASRGSSALTDGVRWQMNLMTFSKEDAKRYGVPVEEKGFHLTATITKNNYAPPQPSVLLKRGAHGVLEQSNLVPTVTVKTRNLEEAVVETVKSEMDGRRRYTKTGFANKFGGIGGRFGVGNNRLRETLQGLLDSGRLVLDTRKKLAAPANRIARADRKTDAS